MLRAHWGSFCFIASAAAYVKHLRWGMKPALSDSIRIFLSNSKLSGVFLNLFFNKSECKLIKIRKKKTLFYLSIESSCCYNEWILWVTRTLNVSILHKFKNFNNFIVHFVSDQQVHCYLVRGKLVKQANCFWIIQ